MEKTQLVRDGYIQNIFCRDVLPFAINEQSDTIFHIITCVKSLPIFFFYMVRFLLKNVNELITEKSNNFVNVPKTVREDALRFIRIFFTESISLCPFLN